MDTGYPVLVSDLQASLPRKKRPGWNIFMDHFRWNDKLQPIWLWWKTVMDFCYTVGMIWNEIAARASITNSSSSSFAQPSKVVRKSNLVSAVAEVRWEYIESSKVPSGSISPVCQHMFRLNNSHLLAIGKQTFAGHHPSELLRYAVKWAFLHCEGNHLNLVKRDMLYRVKSLSSDILVSSQTFNFSLLGNVWKGSSKVLKALSKGLCGVRSSEFQLWHCIDWKIPISSEKIFGHIHYFYKSEKRHSFLLLDLVGPFGPALTNDATRKKWTVAQVVTHLSVSFIAIFNWNSSSAAITAIDAHERST